jgi:PST family polysaccharide transporter
MISKFQSFIKKEKRLVGNFFSLSVLQVFTYVLPLLVLPYLVRTLGVEKFGLVAFAQSFIMFFNIIVDFGFTLSATREISVNREDKEKVTEIFSSVIIIKCILIILSYLIMNIIVFSYAKFANEWILFNLSFLLVIGQALFPVWYFQGMERMKYITIVNVTSKILFTLLIFLFIHNSSDYIYVPLLNGGGMVTGGILSLLFIKKAFSQRFRFYNTKTVLYHFRESSHFFMSRVAVSIYTTSNAFVLGLFTNNTMVGYYSVAEKLYQAIQQCYNPIVQALYPYVAKERNIRLFKKIFTGIVIVNICGISFLYFSGAFIFNILFSKSLGPESLQVFHILLMAAVVVVPSVMLGYPFLAALGFPGYANYSVIIGSAFHLAGLVVLISVNKVSIYTVAGMVLATEFLVLILRSTWAKLIMKRIKI